MVLETVEAPEMRCLAELLYGTGMRISEALQLRVKDVEFDRLAIVVRHGKGGKDRVVMLPPIAGAEAAIPARSCKGSLGVGSS
jgi:site-specific recombinase XerD